MLRALDAGDISCCVVTSSRPLLVVIEPGCHVRVAEVVHSGGLADLGHTLGMFRFEGGIKGINRVFDKRIRHGVSS